MHVGRKEGQSAQRGTDSMYQLLLTTVDRPNNQRKWRYGVTVGLELSESGSNPANLPICNLENQSKCESARNTRFSSAGSEMSTSKPYNTVLVPLFLPSTQYQTSNSFLQYQML